jgi:hypothetical protein
MTTYTNNDMRNNDEVAVTIADNVDGARCELCGHDIVDGQQIILRLDDDRAICYSHVGATIDYGVWMGTGVDITGVLVDDGEYIGMTNSPWDDDDDAPPCMIEGVDYMHLA